VPTSQAVGKSSSMSADHALACSIGNCLMRFACWAPVLHYFLDSSFWAVSSRALSGWIAELCPRFRCITFFDKRSMNRSAMGFENSANAARMSFIGTSFDFQPKSVLRHRLNRSSKALSSACYNHFATNALAIACGLEADDLKPRLDRWILRCALLLCVTILLFLC